MAHRPVALTVAGSDSGGGAGIQADLATFAARGVFGTSAVTALTAQNTRGVTAAEPTEPALVASQVDAVADDFPVGAAKTGMLGNESVVSAVADALSGGAFPVVVDPVMVAESGDALLSPDGERALAGELLPEAALVTPNVAEAERLTGEPVGSVADTRRAGRELVELGADAALVTGGHLDGATDVYVGDDERVFEDEPIDVDGTHGSGCTLSAAIAAELAKGAALDAAVERGRDHVRHAIRAGHSLGAGPGPVNPYAPVRRDAGLPDALRAVRRTVRAFEREGGRVRPLVPEVGTNVAVAPPCATQPAHVAGFDGRLVRTADGVRAAGGVLPGGSDHVARLLLAVRETDPSIRAACNVRRTEATVVALERAGLEAVAVDRTVEPPSADGTMDWVGARASRDRERAPDAIYDDGAPGKEPMVRLLAADAASLRETVFAVADALDA